MGVSSPLTVLAARVQFRDNDGFDSAELLIDRKPEYGVYTRYPMKDDHRLSDEQQQIVGGERPKAPSGWYVYIATDGPLATMFTWGGKPDQGFGRWRRTIKFRDHTMPASVAPEELEVVGGWHPGASAAAVAALDLVDVSYRVGEWDGIGMASFALRDAVKEALPPEIEMYESHRGTDYKWAGSYPTKHEWRAAHRIIRQAGGAAIKDELGKPHRRNLILDADERELMKERGLYGGIPSYADIKYREEEVDADRP